MKPFLGILIILCMIGAVISIVRGVIAMLRQDHMRLNSEGVSESSAKQNQMMWRRIQFQAGAIVLVVVLLLLARSQTG
jgi:NADH:ubiquinone oxidoreductase subunit 6 (subunit J)